MPTCATQPSLERTRAVADILFTQFVRQRFNQAGLDEEPLLLDREEQDTIAAEPNEFDQYSNYTNNNPRTTTDNGLRDNERNFDMERLVEAGPIMASYGRELRRIAEQFEQTRLRQQIKTKANEVTLNTTFL